MEHIDRQYPHDRWTLAYTDGSAESAVKNGGSGIYIRYPCGESSTLSVPGGKYCSNFKAEVLALTTAAKHLAQSQRTSPLIAILTDSLSTLQALTSENIESDIKDLKEHLQDLTSNHHVVLQWIPAHCGIPGNERADQLAKEGSLQIQPNGKQSYREITTLLKQKCRNDWKKIQGNHHPQSDQLWPLDRKDATTIYRLRTGHCGLRGHLKRIGVRDIVECQCQTAVQTPTHILQDCPLYQDLRDRFWPKDTKVEEKLWGTQPDLRATSRVISATGLRL
ncbi:uncharacterized protein LOC135500128 [Lineus longissimus]|uniref:uncharacterized protein LOC135500128 n=1 Tax=Lineus longissimus TaxID=88925 RepID=UPI00315D5CB6